MKGLGTMIGNGNTGVRIGFFNYYFSTEELSVYSSSNNYNSQYNLWVHEVKVYLFSLFRFLGH